MTITIFLIVALIMSAVFHEYAHGWAAFKLGDNTAKSAGRLTLNPIPHLDIFGSILLPLILVLSNVGFFIAWAKPVPYNPFNLRDPKYGGLKVAIAGPAMNFIIAIVFGLVARFLDISAVVKYHIVVDFLQGNNEMVVSAMSGSIINSVFVMSVIFCFINLALMIFNLIPVPPLDGSKILFPFLSSRLQEWFYKIESFGIFILVFLIYFGFFSFVAPLLVYLFSFLTGV